MANDSEFINYVVDQISSSAAAEEKTSSNVSYGATVTSTDAFGAAESKPVAEADTLVVPAALASKAMPPVGAVLGMEFAAKYLFF